ncbi:MAG: SGNH/GDSL hydrolase family protein [Alistipes sp.]|jgi:lysophospholipase L1-like esterase|nr:SGNH/GDSL hydrolase family protein [Alistipes sp.]
MKRLPILSAAILTLAALTLQSAETQAQTQPEKPRDWANYTRYAQANAEQKSRPTPPDAVFMGNSITDGWASQHPDFFEANNYVGRGISGQVTAQMLARFRADVLDLRPKAVAILAGTNDLAQNEGFVSIENIAGNIISMAELARAHGIRVAICSVLPADDYPWRPAITGVPEMVRSLNELLAAWASVNGCVYVDYFSAMDDGNGGLPPSLARDGIHPTSAGYDIMEGIIKPAIDRLLVD